MCHAHARPCLSTGWALNRRFGRTSETAAVLAQGGGVHVFAIGDPHVFWCMYLRSPEVMGVKGTRHGTPTPNVHAAPAQCTRGAQPLPRSARALLEGRGGQRSSFNSTRRHVHNHNTPPTRVPNRQGLPPTDFTARPNRFVTALSLPPERPPLQANPSDSECSDSALRPPRCLFGPPSPCRGSVVP